MARFLEHTRIKDLLDNPNLLIQEIIKLSQDPNLTKTKVLRFFSSFHPDHLDKKTNIITRDYYPKAKIVYDITDYLSENPAGGGGRRTRRVRSQKGGAFEKWENLKNPEILNKIINEILAGLAPTGPRVKPLGAEQERQRQAAWAAEQERQRQAAEQERQRQAAEQERQRQAAEQERQRQAAAAAEQERQRQASAQASPQPLPPNQDFAIIEIPESQLKTNLNTKSLPNKILISSDMTRRINENPLIIEVGLVPETQKIVQHIFISLINQPNINSGGATGIILMIMRSGNGSTKILTYSFVSITKSPKNIHFTKTINNTSSTIQQLVMPINCNVFKPLKKKSEFSVSLKQYADSIQQFLLSGLGISSSNTETERQRKAAEEAERQRKMAEEAEALRKAQSEPVPFPRFKSMEQARRNIAMLRRMGYTYEQAAAYLSQHKSYGI
jgi:hypothetical protein